MTDEDNWAAWSKHRAGVEGKTGPLEMEIRALEWIETDADGEPAPRGQLQQYQRGRWEIIRGIRCSVAPTEGNIQGRRPGEMS